MNDNSLTLRLIVAAVAASLVLEPVAFAQQAAPPAAAAPAKQGAAAPASQAAPVVGGKFSQQNLDELLAPIALYPDALLAQIFMAATYPLEVVEAARWQKQNATLKDKALEEALQKQTWDPSVKSLTAVPQVLTMMNEKLDWTTNLGDAFLAQQEDILKTVQSLRAKAQQSGNLKSGKEQVVKQEVENNTTVIKIEQADPQVMSVPVYNPATVYGSWWYSYPPPYYYYPPGYAYGSGLAFATGVFVGAAIWGNIGWGNNNVNINVNKYNNFNKTNISNGNWNHNAEHRKGASYRDNATASKYGKGGDRAASQSRDQFRGRAEQGRSEMQRTGANEMQNRASAADRSAAQQRGGGGDYGGGGSRGSASASSRGGSSGFSGAGGGGASARSASSRGGSSMGGARGGGGGRGGGRR